LQPCSATGLSARPAARTKTAVAERRWAPLPTPTSTLANALGDPLCAARVVSEGNRTRQRRIHLIADRAGADHAG
jgi:hypothetical protein